MNEKLLCVMIHTILFIESSHSQYCNEIQEKPFIYKLVKFNAYSKQLVLARKQVSNVIKCKEFAAEKRALAFNYGYYKFSKALTSQGLNSRNETDDPYNKNCIVLMCPEINNFTGLANVKGFNYYSTYKKIWLGANRTLSCVPTAGLFMISSDKLNYTEARNSCQNLNASLAHIATEIRTNHLAKLIGNYSFYIGLSSQKDDKTWRNECNEPLSCFSFRAWGEGHPTKSYGCVSLTRPDPTSLPVWQNVPCKKQLRYICELAFDYRRPNSTDKKVLPNCGSPTSGQSWGMILVQRHNPQSNVQKKNN